MSSFTRYDAPLRIQYHKTASKLLGRDLWVVTEPFVYYVGSSPDTGVFACVPTGFLTDGASVPRMFWGLIPPWGEYGQAAVLHDYLCEYATLASDGKPIEIKRYTIDHIFEEAMEVIGVGSKKRFMIANAVHMFRKFGKPKCPSKTPVKEYTESLIRDNIIHHGDHACELFDEQVLQIMDKFNLK